MNSLRLLRVLIGGGAGGYRRLGYLVVTVAVAAVAWLALSAMVEVFLNGAGGAQVKFPGVRISNGMRPGAGLPLPYMRRIETIPGARNVNWSTLLVVNCRQSPVTRAVLSALGGPGASARVIYLTTKDNHPIDQAILARWQADPLGILVSRHTAANCDWHAGESVELPGLVGSKPILFHVIGVLRTQASSSGFAHFDYINRLGAGLFGKDNVMFVQVRAKTVRENERLAARIVTAFAHDAPNVTATTDATVQNAAARFGKVQQLLVFVMAMILMCAASVLISVLAHSAAQRRPRFALLQVLGFRRGTLFVTVVLEGLLIVALGAALGAVLGQWMAHLVGASTALGRLFIGYDFAPPTWAYLWMVPWLAGLLVVALIAPALVIRRTRAVDAQVG